MPTSKRKEHAQEVEFVSIYNKRLRKSFLMSQNVYKQPAQPYNVLHSKLRSGTCSNDSLLPQTPHSKAINVPKTTIACMYFELGKLVVVSVDGHELNLS